MAPNNRDGSDDAPTLASPSDSFSGSDATAEVATGPASSAGSHSVESPAQLRPGDLFAGRYRIASFLSRGGFSFVYRAQDLSSGETVALKFLAAREGGQDLVDRMRRELRLARDLRHPNIVRVYDLHEFGGFYGLSMEYVEGMSLKELVLSRKVLPVDEAIGYWRSLTSAMAAVHAAGIVHRDLKPHNVMVSPAGDVKLLDFGLARTPDSTGLTATGTILGTPDYMSPEQVEGKEADARSDVYSLGITAYELLVGEPPYRGDSSLAVAFQHVRSRVPDPRIRRPEIPERVARLVLRMTEPVPAKRPASAQDLLVDLASLSAKEGRVRGRRAIPIALGASALLLAAAGTLWWRGRASAGDSDPLADGVVHLALATARPGEILGGGPFLSAVRDALAGRASGAPVRLHSLSSDDALAAVDGPTRLAGDGIEQLLVVALSAERDAVGPLFRVDGDVLDTRSGRLWRRIEGAQVRSLDFESVDLAAQRLSAGYRAAVAGTGAPPPPPPPPSSGLAD